MLIVNCTHTYLRRDAAYPRTDLYALKSLRVSYSSLAQQ